MNTPASVNMNTSSSFSERESFSNYCKKYGKQALLDQWDHSRNSEFNPEIVSAKSHQRVWWKCEKGMVEMCGRACVESEDCFPNL